MLIIGVMGPIGAGKSTVADCLVQTHGFARVKFAGALKAMMRALGLTDREIEGDLKEAPCPALGGRTPRYAMQTLGTEWGRNLIEPDLWVRTAMAEIGRLRRAGRLAVVVDDCRFQNEAAAIRAAGGLIWRVVRDEGAETAAPHASEREWSLVEPDLTLCNRGTRDELERAVGLAVERAVVLSQAVR